AHDLLRVSFSTVPSSPEGPALPVADSIAGVPELWRYPGVARSPDQFSYTAVLYPVSFLAVELEVVPLLVDAPAVVCDHQDSILRVLYELVIVPVPRLHAPVRHSDDSKLIGVDRHALIATGRPHALR